MGTNLVCLNGYLGSDPELKFVGTQSAPKLSLRMATDERYWVDGEGWKSHVEWHNVVVWGKRAEKLARLLFKGSPVCVQGCLRTRSFDKEGQKHYRTEVLVAGSGYVLPGVQAPDAVGGDGDGDGGNGGDDADGGRPF